MLLKKSDLNDFLSSPAGYEVLVPIESAGRIELGVLGSSETVLDYQNLYLSPKGLFFPQSERLFEFGTDPGDEESFILKDVPERFGPRVVFGIRPCDAKAFFVLDRIFTNDQYRDPYWVRKRESTVLIGLGCNAPCPTCFCTSVKCGPFHAEGLDVLAFDLGEEYLLNPVSARGEKLLGQGRGLRAANGESKSRAAALVKASESAVTSRVSVERIGSRTVLELYEAEHWNRVHESCLNCGTCTYVCPTCHCFDIQDEVSGLVGDRVRNWDTCMSWLFTMHGTGHNPRPGKKERVRQRFMHKFKYIPIKRGGEFGCVGCGRCVSLCPVNIDVRDVVTAMNA